MNWHTREALLLLTAHSEKIYKAAVKEPTMENFEKLLFEVEKELKLDIEHLMYSEIDFDYLIEQIKEKTK